MGFIIIDFLNLGKQNRICYTGRGLRRGPRESEGMFSGFRLRLKKTPGGRLIFTIPLGYKLLLLIIGLLILIALIVTASEQEGSILVRQNTIPLIICFLSFLGAAYHERWIFDREQNQIIHQNGIFVLHSNKVYRISELEKIEVSSPGYGSSTEGRPISTARLLRRRITLSLRMTSGKRYRLEIYRNIQRQHVENEAFTLSEYCGVPADIEKKPM